MTKNCQSIVNVFNVQIKQILDGYEFSWVLQNMAIDDQNGNSNDADSRAFGKTITVIGLQCRWSQ